MFYTKEKKKQKWSTNKNLKMLNNLLLKLIKLKL